MHFIACGGSGSGSGSGSGGRCVYDRPESRNHYRFYDGGSSRVVLPVEVVEASVVVVVVGMKEDIDSSSSRCSSASKRYGSILIICGDCIAVVEELSETSSLISAPIAW